MLQIGSWGIGFSSWLSHWLTVWLRAIHFTSVSFIFPIYNTCTYIIPTFAKCSEINRWKVQCNCDSVGCHEAEFSNICQVFWDLWLKQTVVYTQQYYCIAAITLQDSFMSIHWYSTCYSMFNRFFGGFCTTLKMQELFSKETAPVLLGGEVKAACHARLRKVVSDLSYCPSCWFQMQACHWHHSRMMPGGQFDLVIAPHFVLPDGFPNDSIHISGWWLNISGS